MLKLGFNTHALNLSNPTALSIWVAKNHPSTMLVLNSPQAATAFANMGVPYVILRMTNNDDSIHLKIRSAQEWWDSVKANYVDERLIVHFGNEPHTDFARLSQFSLDLAKLIGNRRAVFGNFSVGTPEQSDWVGALSPLIDLISSNDNYFLGLHEYLMGVPEINIPFEISRYRALRNLFPNRNIPILFTEFGTDIIQDVKTHHPEVGNTRGFRDYNNEDLVYFHIKYIFDQFYNADDDVKGVNFFCYGNSGGWETYNAENSGMLSKFEGLVKEDEVTQYNQQVTIQATDPLGARRRTGPSTATPINGLVTGAVVVTKLAVSGDWTQYRFSDGVYWVNSTVITERVLGSTIAINLYNAPQEDIDKANSLFSQLLDLLKKYNADVT